MLENLTKRDAYFVGYADAYAKRITQIDRENRTFQESLDHYPDAGWAPELRLRISENNREKKRLSCRIQNILANVRR